LNEARKAIVQRRRDLVREIAKARFGAMPPDYEKLAAYQNAIEAIDRAIDDEEALMAHRWQEEWEPLMRLASRAKARLLEVFARLPAVG
jgi:hypothetical protein